MSCGPKVVNFDFILYMLIKLFFRQNEAGGFLRSWADCAANDDTFVSCFSLGPCRSGHMQQTLKWWLFYYLARLIISLLYASTNLSKFRACSNSNTFRWNWFIRIIANVSHDKVRDHISVDLSGNVSSHSLSLLKRGGSIVPHPITLWKSVFNLMHYYALLHHWQSRLIHLLCSNL